MGGCFAVISEINYNATRFDTNSVIYSGEIYDTYVNGGFSQFIIVLLFWILVHFGGALVRTILYTDPFLISPDEPGTSTVVLLMFKRLGP